MAGQRIISTLLAAVVFIASINCVCHAATLPAASAPHACCAENSAKHHNQRDNSGTHDSKCIHCQRSLINDSLSVKQRGQQLDLAHTFPALADAAFHIGASAQPQLFIAFNDLSPPLVSATLLSLHCALLT